MKWTNTLARNDQMCRATAEAVTEINQYGKLSHLIYNLIKVQELRDRKLTEDIRKSAKNSKHFQGPGAIPYEACIGHAIKMN